MLLSLHTVLNILIVTNGWGVKTIAGGEYHILRVLERWSKEHKVSIIIPKSGYLFSKNILLSSSSVAAADNYPIYLSSHENEVRGHSRELFYYILRILRSSFLFKFKQKPDVIIATSHLIYDVLPALILRKRLRLTLRLRLLNNNSKKNSKLVVYVHHILRPFRSYKQGIWSNINLLNEKISLLLCKKEADLVFVVNPEIKDALIAKGFDANKIVITGNGVEHDFIDSVKVNGEKIYDGCFCGRIDPKKGVYDLIEIWEKVVKSFPQAKLVIIGDGPEYDNLVEIVKNKTLDKNITLTGFVSETEKILLIKSAKIFVSPSYEEGWGVAVSEAMACGLAVVCYNLSAYKIFDDGIIKVEVGNKKGISQHIVDLLICDDKRIDLARQGRDLVYKMSSWDDISAQQLRAIRKF